MKELWQKILQIGNKDHKCLGCNRGIGAGNEKASFETYVSKSSGIVADHAGPSSSREMQLRGLGGAEI